MSLKLVTDNTVAELGVCNLQDIATCARRFADEVEAGEHGDVVQVTVLIETVDRLKRESWGEMPSGYELMGIFQAATLAVFSETDSED